MNQRLGHSYMTNSIAIRQEIQRFESVHPSIYAIYDLIEAIPDLLIQQQIREHVVCIEDSFVNSQEWTLSRSVPDLKLGILGTVNSGKSALVHRYLTGSYLQEESPEGGRFKKEVLIDGQSYLLLIRDEGGLPEMQFTQWVDAVIFVFSLENELSFNAIYSFFAKMSHHHTNVMHDIPIILVGTQDAISESNPRLIDDTRARKLASDLKKCAYYETCATYGLNVERVFLDACQKIILARHQHSDIFPSSGPSIGSRAPLHHPMPHHQLKQGYETHSYSSSGSGGLPLTPTQAQSAPHHGAPSPPFSEAARDSNKDRKYKDLPRDDREVDIWDTTPLITPNNSRKLSNSSFSNHINSAHDSSSDRMEQKFPKIEEETRNRLKSMELGSGRVIPVKQGILHKKSNKALNKDWKKKYFTLLDDGRLTYHPTLHDYMENVKGKEINLLRTTVKIPGQRPKGSERSSNGQSSNSNPSSEGNRETNSEGIPLLDQQLPAFLLNLDPSHPLIVAYTHGDQGVAGTPVAKTPSTENQNKKKPKKSKSSQDDAESCDFMVVSLDNTVWHLEAQSAEERDDWVSVIEQQILACLQLNFSDKSKNNVSNTVTDRNVIQRMRVIKGNMKCADCDMPNPDWASVNLGIIVCIECSGIHRNLGTHLSRIRSLDLDEWPPNLVLAMTSIGNRLANSIWEGNCGNKHKPEPSASREEKERWIRSKYENKEFLPNPPYVDVALPQQLIDAIARQDIHNTILVLAYCTPELVNTPYSNTDTRRALHIAAALGNQVLVQLLLWHGANVRLLDHEGYNPLFYARSAGNIVCAELLRTQGSPGRNGHSALIPLLCVHG